MEKLTAIIVEDMPQSLQMLESDIKTYCPYIEVIGTAFSVVSASKLLRQKQPDILFLDITLGDGSAFDLLEIFPGLTSKIIFITASDEYAIKAFRFSAIDYLLKPIDSHLLIAAVNKIKPNQNALDLLKETIKNPQELPKRITLHTQEKISVYNIHDIVRCESDVNNTWFYLINGEKLYVTKTLKYFEDMLEHHHFIRVHQSHLINFSHISEFNKKDGGFLKMKNGHEVPVSVRKRAALLELFDDLS